MFSYRKCIKLNLQFSHEDSNIHIESLPFQDGLKKFLGTTLWSTFGFSCPILPLTSNPNQATELSFNVTNFEKAELSCSLLIKVSLYTWSWDKTIGLCSTVARLKKTNYKLFLLIGVSTYTCSWVQGTVKLILNISNFGAFRKTDSISDFFSNVWFQVPHTSINFKLNHSAIF